MKRLRSTLPPCPRSLTRTLTLRRRPVAMLLVGLALWLAVYLFSVHGSFASAPTIPDAAMQRMALHHQLTNQLYAIRQIGINITNDIASIDLLKTAEEKKAFEKEESEFVRRRQHYESLCQAGLTGPVGDIHYYEPAKLALCLVPKVGSTYWKRLLHFVYKDTDGRPLASSLDIDRYHVTFESGNKVKVASYYRSKAMLDSFNKVIFVRDPWSRVWSSFVDKLVLPDSWQDHGLAIVSRRTDQRRRTKHCADDVKFVEFVDYVVNTNRDSHWRPVSKVCNPCVYKPQYVGKIETFAEDTQHILRLVGLRNLTEGKDSTAVYTEDQVRQITDYHFRLYDIRPLLQRCLAPSGLAKRLWQAFVLNGYIADNMTFPREEFTNALDTTTNMREAGVKASELLVKYHKRSPVMTSRQLVEYKRSVMAHHYRKAPRQLLEKLADIFSADFNLFDYDPRPSDIFLPYADVIAPGNSSEIL